MSGRKRLPQNLTLRYVLALALIGLLSTSSYSLLNTLLTNLKTDAPQMNVSGRQRMLSQRVAKTALRLSHATSDAERVRLRDRLVSDIQLMDESHQALIQGNEELGISEDLATNLRDLYFGSVNLDGSVQAFIGHAKAFAALPNKQLTPDAIDLQVLLDMSDESLLADLNAAVSLYEQNSSTRAHYLFQLETIVWGSSLALLLLEALLIFGPMVAQIRALFADLCETNDRLVAKDQRFNLLLDSTQDGLLPVDTDGRITEGASSQILEWFGPCVVGTPFWRYLLPARAKEFQVGFEQIHDRILPFEVCVDQAIDVFERNGRSYGIDYRKIETGDQLSGYLLAIRDITEKLAKEQLEADAREFNQVVYHALHDQQGFRRFVKDTRDHLATLLCDSVSESMSAHLLHIVKGNSAIFGLEQFSLRVHDAEDRLLNGEPRRAVVSELEVAFESSIDRYRDYVFGNKDIKVTPVEYDRLLSRLSKGDSAAAILPTVKRWQHEPVSKNLERLANMADSLAERRGKKINVTIDVCQELRVDTKRFGHVWNTMNHVVRNAVDHGIESPKDRESAGKSEIGRLRLSCEVKNRALSIAVTDDGKGIDWHNVGKQAVASRLPNQSHDDLVDALFELGLSTSDSITETSGRGVGLAAVNEAVRKSGGTIKVDSEFRKGTTIRIHLPLPLDAAYTDFDDRLNDMPNGTPVGTPAGIPAIG